MILFDTVCHLHHSFKTRTGPAGRTGWTMNRWCIRFELSIGSVM